MLHYTPEPKGEREETRVLVSLNDAYSVHPIAVDVSAVPYNTVWPGHQRPFDQAEAASYIRFSMDEPVTLTVRYDVKPFTKAVVRPLSAGIKPEIDGDTVRFVIQKPGNYVLECGDFHNALHIFAENPAEPIPEGALVYTPGIHHVGIVELDSDMTVYLEEGAVVYGGFTAVGKHNIRIMGHGTIDGHDEVRYDDTEVAPNGCTHCHGEQFRNQIFHGDDKLIRAFLLRTKMRNGCIRFYHCTDVKVSDVVLRDSCGWVVVTAGCDGLVFDGIKIVGQWKYNTDGIDVCNCKNVVIRNSFVRAFDDAIVLKGLKGWDDENGNLENILVENNVVWCDWGRTLEIGAETTADLYQNITFENCDLIHGDSYHMDIQNVGRAEHKNIVFRNIRCEYQFAQQTNVYQTDMTQPYPCADKPNCFQPQLMYIVTLPEDVYGQETQKGSVHDILYENIQVFLEDGVAMPSSHFLGLSAEHPTYNVTVKGLYVNGKRVTDVEESNIRHNEFGSFELI